MGSVEVYRKKPVAVSVMRVLDEEDFADAATWLDSYDVVYLVTRYPGKPVSFQVRTLEGDMAWTPGAWLIKGVHDEFYFCDDAVFRKTYDFVGPLPNDMRPATESADLRRALAENERLAGIVRELAPKIEERCRRDADQWNEVLEKDFRNGIIQGGRVACDTVVTALERIEGYGDE